LAICQDAAVEAFENLLNDGLSDHAIDFNLRGSTIKDVIKLKPLAIYVQYVII